MKIYGPYNRKDGRQHVILYDGKNRTTISYAKYLMENYLKRKLSKNETVDHINGDFTDNRIENLQILSRADNIRKSAKGRQMIEFNCPICNTLMIKPLNVVKNNRKQGKSGPYCGRSCAGKASHLA